MADAVDELATWARRATALPMPAELVPGAGEDERRALAALGGLARVLVDRRTRSMWPDAVQEWCDDGPEPPPDVAAVLDASLSGESDVLSALYERLVTGRSRRRLGTFFTPPHVVQFMLDRIAHHVRSPASVIDPGAGVGAFTIAAGKRWPKTRTVAVDLNVVTLGLLALRCSMAKVTNVDLVHGDYLTWIAAQTDDCEEDTRVLLGNPPYTRHQELDAKTKQLLREPAADLVDSGLAGLSAYFMAASLTALRPRDGLCFVLPGTWTEARYGLQLREWLWNATERAVELHAFPPALEVFEGTRVTAMVVVVGPEKRTQQQLTIHHGSLRGSTVATTKGQPRSRRTKVPALGPLLWRATAAPKRDDRVPLSDIATVHRGVATGANHFFFLGDDELEGLPDAAYVPALRRLRHVESDVLDQPEHDRIGAAGHDRWMLWLTDPAVVGDEEVAYRLTLGRRQGVDKTVLATRRHPWYVVERVAPPDIFIALMSRGAIRAVSNELKAVGSNSMYGIYVENKAIVDPLCTWLNSEDGQRAIVAKGRHYSGGLVKLEPREWLTVCVPIEQQLLGE